MNRKTTTAPTSSFLGSTTEAKAPGILDRRKHETLALTLDHVLILHLRDGRPGEAWTRPHSCQSPKPGGENSNKGGMQAALQERPKCECSFHPLQSVLDLEVVRWSAVSSPGIIGMIPHLSLQVGDGQEKRRQGTQEGLCKAQGIARDQCVPPPTPLGIPPHRCPWTLSQSLP